MNPPPPLGVVVDLDDTLYPQADYLAGAAAAVGAAADGLGCDGAAVQTALAAQLAAGSDTGGTIDRALLDAGVARGDLPRLVPVLVDAFTRHRPVALTPYPGVREALGELARAAPVACLTDGNPVIQDAKLAATGLLPLLRTVVVTDRLGGRRMRKPHPAGLLEAARLLDVPPDRLLVIGDRPGKDVAVAGAVDALAIRVRQGEHAGAADEPPAWRTVDTFPSAVALALTALTAEPARSFG